MISIHLEAADLENIRFAYSPLLEAVMSYRTLFMPGASVPIARWGDDVRRTLYGVEFPYLDATLLGPRYIVDFMTPTPATVERVFEEEIERARATPDEIIRRNVAYLIELDGTTAPRQQFMVYPRESLECLIEELRLFWQHAIAPHWSRVTSVLEADMLYHARILALNGVDRMIGELHPRLRYRPGVLMLDKDHCVRKVTDYYLRGTGIDLVPAVFSAACLSWQIEPEWQPMVIYGARGAGLWYEPSLPDPEDALVQAVGQGRARLLLALKTPGHTSELAQRLEVTAGAVSQQLGRLNQAGLVESRRSSNRVYYQLTARGEKLLLLFAG